MISNLFKLFKCLRSGWTGFWAI